MSEYYDEANKLLREWTRNDWRGVASPRLDANVFLPCSWCVLKSVTYQNSNKKI